MEKRIHNIALALAVSLTATAQTDIAARFDMTVGSDNTITEGVSSGKWAVNGALAPENVDGAVGFAP